MIELRDIFRTGKNVLFDLHSSFRLVCESLIALDSRGSVFIVLPTECHFPTTIEKIICQEI